MRCARRPPPGLSPHRREAAPEVVPDRCLTIPVTARSFTNPLVASGAGKSPGLGPWPGPGPFAAATGGGLRFVPGPAPAISIARAYHD
jgi:hypothetical protein